jgi:Flp pilus assembly protein TadD
VPLSGADDTLQRRRAAAALACVLLAVLAAWLRSLSGEFVYDDQLLIVRNPAMAQLSSWPAVLGRGMWSFLDAQDAQQVGYWRPLTGLVQLFTNVLGHGSPLVFHWVSLLLHLAATGAAFALALELARSLPVALMAALLFGLHPVHVESVAWISALNDPLYGLFALLALRSWIRWRRAGSPGSPWRAGLLLLLALASKELALAVVPLVLLYDLVRERAPGEPAGALGGIASAGMRAWLPFALAVLLWYACRVAVFGELSAGFARTTTWFGVGAGRLAQLRVELFGGFTWLSFWPVDLKLLHPFKPALSATDPQFLRALVCGAGLVAAFVWAWRARARTLAYALAFLPISVLPALVRLESLSISPLSERYLYVGVFGFVLALVWCLWRWLPRALAIALCLVIGALYSLRTVDRTAFWHDELTLFRTLRAQTPEVIEPCWGLGRVLLERYRVSGAPEDLREATESFFTGLHLLTRAQQGDGSIFATRSDAIQVNLGVGWCLLYQGESSGDTYNGAYQAFQDVVNTYRRSDQALVGLASAQIQRREYENAEKSLRQALALNERNAEAHHNLALVLLSRNSLDEACREFERALELRPAHLEDQIWLARISLQQGKEDQARAWIARARAAHPDSTGPLVVEATAAARRQQFDEALKLVDQALVRSPDDGEALALKGTLHLQRGEKNSAQQALLRACELLPTDFEVHYNMGALLLPTSIEEALPYLVRAYELRPPGPAGETLRATLAQLPFHAARVPCELAKADLARADVAGASAWVAKARTLEPQNGEVALLAGDLAQRRGDNAEAERELLEACKLLPASLEARYTLASVYVALNRGQDAERVLEELLAVSRRQGAGTPEEEFMRQRAREMLEELRAK